EPPRLHDAIREPVLTGPAHVVHQLFSSSLDDGLADARAKLVEHLVPRHALPLAAAARAHAPQRIENAIRILELVRRDDALRARAAAAAGVHGIAFDLPDVERVLVDVGDDAARRFAVEADARNDPVAAPVLLRPTLGLKVDKLIPGRGIRVRPEFRHGRTPTRAEGKGQRAKAMNLLRLPTFLECWRASGRSEPLPSALCPLPLSCSVRN